jgi:hypothetical protein
MGASGQALGPAISESEKSYAGKRLNSQGS